VRHVRIRPRQPLVLLATRADAPTGRTVASERVAPSRIVLDEIFGKPARRNRLRDAAAVAVTTTLVVMTTTLVAVNNHARCHDNHARCHDNHSCWHDRVTRVATVETESEWLDFARGKSVRQLERVIAAAWPGDTPDFGAVARPSSPILRFEVTPETFALFGEATQRLRRETDARLDDDAILLAMARCRFQRGRPRPRGRSSQSPRPREYTRQANDPAQASARGAPP
jgi:hypothetical protein